VGGIRFPTRDLKPGAVPHRRGIQQTNSEIGRGVWLETMGRTRFDATLHVDVLRCTRTEGVVGLSTGNV